MRGTITLLPGDGIGPEIVAEAEKTLRAVAEVFGHHFGYRSALIGGVAIDERGDPLPPETLDACRASQAVLLGAVGGPKWDGGELRPEAGLLKLRKELGLYANLRPVRGWAGLEDASPLKADRMREVDLLFVRELTGGIYFGEPRVEGDERALDTMVYTEPEVRRIVRKACELAKLRKGHVTSIDKANVLASMRLWRKVATDEASRHEGITLDHQLVDSAAMRLVTDPSSFDVVVAPNLFGDVLSDEGAAITGTLGLLPSASLGDGSPGLYEPIHGSAPDIAGQGKANPAATILSVAMMLRYAFDLSREAAVIEAAVAETLWEGVLTPDLGGSATTSEMGDAIGTRIAKVAGQRG
jgi:3-isopropylmalate dehydrogenase